MYDDDHIESQLRAAMKEATRTVTGSNIDQEEIHRTVARRRVFRRLGFAGGSAGLAAAAALTAVFLLQPGGGNDVETERQPAADTSPATTETTEPTVTVPSTTTAAPGTTSSVATSTAECTREAVAASLGYRLDEVLSDPVCQNDWGWVDACPASERDPEVGCLHAGKIIRLEDERWTFVTALLQDCAESFTAHGAPPEVAEKFYPRCF